MSFTKRHVGNVKIGLRGFRAQLARKGGAIALGVMLELPRWGAGVSGRISPGNQGRSSWGHVGNTKMTGPATKGAQGYGLVPFRCKVSVDVISSGCTNQLTRRSTVLNRSSKARNLATNG